MHFTVEQEDVLEKVLLDPQFQSLIGAGDWSLTEAEETILWEIIDMAKDLRT
jgi:hypothetical protein